MPRGRRSKEGAEGDASPPPAAGQASLETGAPSSSSSLPSIKLRLPKIGGGAAKAAAASASVGPTSSELSEMPSSSANADEDEDEDEDMADATQTQIGTPQRPRRSVARGVDDGDDDDDGETPSPSRRGKRKGASGRRQSISASSTASPAKRRARGAKLEDEEDGEGDDSGQMGSQAGDEEEGDEEPEDDDDDDGDGAGKISSDVPWVIQIESGQSSLVHRAVAKILPRHRVGRGVKGAGGRNKTEPAEGAEEEPEKPNAEEPVPPQEEFEVIVNKEKAIMKGEEVIIDEDEQGNTKIDENGELLGDRKYKCPVFSSPFRSNPKLLFAPAIECARALGYKDSLHFFRTNLRLIKITLTQREKDHLIESGKFSNMVRGRNVTVVAMRNVFKIFGHKIVEGGRFVTDDYYESQAREKFGGKEGQRHAEAAPEPTQIVETEASIPGPIGALAAATTSRDGSGKRRDRNAQAAARRNLEPAVVVTHDANGETVITTFGDAGYQPLNRIAGQVRKRKELESEGVSDENWMYEMARSVRGLNADVAQARRERATVFPPSSRSHGGLGPVGWYEPTTNAAHFSLSTQPTSATMEKVYPRPLLEPKLGGGEASKSKKQRSTKSEAAAGAREEAMDEDPDSDVDSTTAGGSVDFSKPSPEVLEQAQRAALEDAKRQQPVLGGSKVGSRAYGVASFEERVLPPLTVAQLGLGEVWGVRRRSKEAVAALGLE